MAIAPSGSFTEGASVIARLPMVDFLDGNILSLFST